MNWLLPRSLATFAAALLGGWLAGELALAFQAPLWLVLAGSAGAVLLMSVLDVLAGLRLMNWLRGTQEAPAPRSAGFWGELAYRIERLLRQREKNVLHEQKRLKDFLSAIEASPNGVMVLDDNDQIQWCNLVAADHFGIDPQRDRLQRVTNLLRSPAFVAYLQRFATGQRKRAADVELADGIQIADHKGRGSLSILVRPYGEGMKFVLSQDVTERERVEAMRRDFVANVSHEIRTPLTVLSGYLETLTNLPLSEPDRQQALLHMTQQALRMQTLVADLLNLAQLEGSPRPTADSWMALDELLAQVQSDAQALSNTQHGQHRLHIAQHTSLELAGSQTELLSALMNLMSNAVRYTPAGGRIDLTVQLQADGFVEIAVIDTGLGIASDLVPRLTERFFRADPSRSRETGSTGLGLSIVKHVAQRHGGELVIQSELGRGSSFKLLLPPARVRVCAPTVPALAATHRRAVA
jgi:two-component system, OmpR family, phosphate regulon sensor histidine kinase PhoR